MHTSSLPPFTYHSLPTRPTSVGDLPRLYLLDYIVCHYDEYLEVLPAGPSYYAILLPVKLLPGTWILPVPRSADIPGVRVLACAPRVATLFFPFAESEQVIKEEVACAFASYEAKCYDIMSPYPAYEKEMHDELQAEHYLDTAA